MGDSKDVYERLVRLYNTGDLESLVNSYTEDAILVTPDGTARGRAAIQAQWSRDKVAFPDRTLTTAVIIEQGDTIASEFTWAATNTGPLVQPDGTELPLTGKRIETKGMELVQVREGKVAVHRGYWDTMALAGQLGLLPGAATDPGRAERSAPFLATTSRRRPRSLAAGGTDRHRPRALNFSYHTGGAEVGSWASAVITSASADPAG